MTIEAGSTYSADDSRSLSTIASLRDKLTRALSSSPKSSNIPTTISEYAFSYAKLAVSCVCCELVVGVVVGGALPYASSDFVGRVLSFYGIDLLGNVSDVLSPLSSTYLPFIGSVTFDLPARL